MPCDSSEGVAATRRKTPSLGIKNPKSRAKMVKERSRKTAAARNRRQVPVGRTIHQVAAGRNRNTGTPHAPMTKTPGKPSAPAKIRRMLTGIREMATNQAVTPDSARPSPRFRAKRSRTRRLRPSHRKLPPRNLLSNRRSNPTQSQTPPKGAHTRPLFVFTCSARCYRASRSSERDKTNH